jgi:hypothetical protein
MCPLAWSSEESRVRDWYFSWGYSRNYWFGSDIHVSQPSLNNNVVFHNVKAVDYPQWTENGFIFNKDITTPQFVVQIGRVIDHQNDLALEFTLDHTKLSSVQGQQALVTGTVGGQLIHSYQVLSGDYFTYYLHNGANHVMFHLVKKYRVLGQKGHSWSIAALGKVGLGFMLPHSENVILGNANDVGKKSLSNLAGFDSGWWRVNGWTTGIELGLQAVLLSPIYFELDDKIAFASLSRVPVYQGYADQKLWMHEWKFNLGVMF